MLHSKTSFKERVYNKKTYFPRYFWLKWRNFYIQFKTPSWILTGCPKVRKHVGQIQLALLTFTKTTITRIWSTPDSCGLFYAMHNYNVWIQVTNAFGCHLYTIWAVLVADTSCESPLHSQHYKDSMELYLSKKRERLYFCSYNGLD